MNREPFNVTPMNLEVPLTVKDAAPLWGQSSRRQPDAILPKLMASD